MVVVVVVVVVVGWGWGLRRADLFDHLDDALLGLHNGHLLDLHPLHHLLHRHLRRPARAAQVSPVRSFARKNARRGRQERARSRAASAIAATDSRGAFSAAPQTCFSEAPKTCRPDGARFLGRACSGPGLAPRWSANETGATPPFAPPRPGRSAPDRPRGAPRRSTAWVTAADRRGAPRGLNACCPGFVAHVFAFRRQWGRTLLMTCTGFSMTRSTGTSL